MTLTVYVSDSLHPAPGPDVLLYTELMTESFRWPRIGLGLLTAALVIVYVYAATGPLRAITSTVADTTGYIGLTAWILDGRTADMHEVPWRCREFPVGYPAAIAGLYQLDLATPRGLLALNFVSLSIGAWASWMLLRRAWGLSVNATWGVLLLVAASTVCGELAVSVASEMLFFALSLLTLLCCTWPALSRASPESSFTRQSVLATGYLILSLFACAAAIAVRTAGIALIPALLWALLAHPLVKRIGTRRVLAWAALPTTVGVWLGVSRILRSEYVADILVSRYSHGAAWDVIAMQQLAKVSAFGELFTNLRSEDFRSVYRGEFVLAGALSLALLLAGLWRRVRQFSAIEIYLAAYAGIIFVYPFFSYSSSRRFWFPVLPFLFALAYLAVDRLREKSPQLRRWAGLALVVYVTAFVLFGCLRSVELSRFERHTDHEAAAALKGLGADVHYEGKWRGTF